MIAKHVRKARIEPDLVLCSSAARTRETLERVRPALGDAAVSIEDGLYAASHEAILERLRAVDDGLTSVMVIGHNPGLQDLALALASTGAGLERLRAKFPTAALATIVVLGGSWSALAPGAAELAAYVVPRELR